MCYIFLQLPCFTFNVPSILASDLAEQVRSLTTTDLLESPRHLRRHSKVLSWISESDDWQIDNAEAGSGEDDASKILATVCGVHT